MTLKNILIVVLLAVGGYYVYTWYQNQVATGGDTSLSSLGSSLSDSLGNLGSSLGSQFAGGNSSTPSASTNPTGGSSPSPITSPTNTASTAPGGDDDDSSDDDSDTLSDAGESDQDDG
jgi:hypothetical protein